MRRQQLYTKEHASRVLCNPLVLAPQALDRELKSLKDDLEKIAAEEGGK